MRESEHRYVTAGEALLHGIPMPDARIEYQMPLSEILYALHFYHLAPSWRHLRIALAAVFMMLSLFFLGFMLGGLPCAAAATLLAAGLNDAWPASATLLQFFYSLLVLLVGGLLVWRGRAPSARRTFLLGLAIGGTLLYRSPLVFFPLMLALFELVFYHRGSIKACRKDLLILCVVPYLFLIPRARLNSTITGRFIPFEDGEASTSIVTGALGFTEPATPGSWGTIVDPEFRGADPNGALSWAAREAFRHPLRYAGYYVARVGYVLRIHPWLLLMAGWVLWLMRERREFHALGLLALYLVLVHCFLSVKSEYFAPLWPLVAALAGVLASFWSGFARPRENSFEMRIGRGIFMTGLVGLLSFSALSLRQAVICRQRVALMRSPQGAELVSAALALHPQDVWLLASAGQFDLERGDFSNAAGHYAQAMTLDPGYPKYRLNWAIAMALLDHVGPLLAYDGEHGTGDKIPEYANKAVCYLHLGQIARAREQIGLAHEEWQYNLGIGGSLDPERTSWARKIVRRMGEESLAGLMLNDAAPWRRKDPGAFSRYAQEFASEMSLTDLHRLMEANVPQGQRPNPAPQDSRAPIASSPDRGAMQSIEWKKANELSRRGLHPLALASLRHLTKEQPEEPELWLAQAREALAMAQKPEALSALTQAERVARTPEARHEVALVLLEAGESARALDILARLNREHEANASYLKDLGICEYKMGRLDAAIRNLSKAVEIDPSLAEAYLSLGSILTQEKRYAQALALYDRALNSQIGAGALRADIERCRQDVAVLSQKTR